MSERKGAPSTPPLLDEQKKGKGGNRRSSDKQRQSASPLRRGGLCSSSRRRMSPPRGRGLLGETRFVVTDSSVGLWDLQELSGSEGRSAALLNAHSKYVDDVQTNTSLVQLRCALALFAWRLKGTDRSSPVKWRAKTRLCAILALQHRSARVRSCFRYNDLLKISSVKKKGRH